MRIAFLLIVSLSFPAACLSAEPSVSSAVSNSLSSRVTPYAQKEARAIRRFSLSATTVRQFEKLEIDVDLAATFDNPFNPDDIALDAIVQSPSGKELRVPGFLHRAYQRTLRNNREVLAPAGAPTWRIRFTPVETGDYRVRLRLQDRNGVTESEPARFKATASEAASFIRISKGDRRYFVDDRGTPYFPVGANTCWAYGRGTFDYDDWFGRYAEVGGNYGRLWLSPHWTTFALERPGKTEEGLGLGQFDLANAWRLDYVLELAAARGLRLMLCIDSYNILREKDGYPQWESTPHNIAHGGPLRRPAEFWTNSVMDKLYRAKLRYLVARYGFSPAVLAWEFWNEADITTDYQSAASRDWHQRMARALRELDPYDHLITTSFASTPGDRAVDTLPEIDYVQTHHYNSPDLAKTLAAAQAQKTAYGKPHFVGEIGADSGGPRSQDDPGGLQIHDPIWVSLATGGSGTAQPWWWDNLIHPRNLYHLFGAAARFVEAINWPAEGFRAVTPRLEWQSPEAPRERSDLVIADGPADWSPTEFNRPRRVRIDRTGARSGLPISRVQHGLGGHRDKHNPVTFELDLPWPTRFEVEVGDVSGHGGAALRIVLDEAEVFATNFHDADGMSDTRTLKQFAGSYGIEVPAGKHAVMVENPGRDWFMASYRLREATEREAPPLLAWSIAGARTAIAWIRVEDRSWQNLCGRKQTNNPVGGGVVTLGSLTAGDWQMELWDTWKGAIRESGAIQVDSSGEARIPLPTIETDLAIKLRRPGANRDATR